jgi:phospholipase/carboxylesterase
VLTHISGSRGHPRPGAPLLVLLHGRGSDEEDLQGLKPLLAPGTTLVTPRAPFEAAPWGYGPGWAWYRYLDEDKVEPDTLERSLGALDRFLTALSEELPEPPGPLVLGGFSQGGTTALAWALTRPGRAVGVANLSGFLVGDPELPLEAAKGLPIFWGHGREDRNIPFELARRGRDRLTRAGARVTALDHPGGHSVTAEEVRALREWVEGLEGTRASA